MSTIYCLGGGGQSLANFHRYMSASNIGGTSEGASSATCPTSAGQDTSDFKEQRQEYFMDSGRSPQRAKVGSDVTLMRVSCTTFVQVALHERQKLSLLLANVRNAQVNCNSPDTTQH